jgi:uncharacterized protein
MALFHTTSGTLLNMLTVLVGGSIGTFIGDRLAERYSRILFIALGLFTAVTGLQEALGAKNSLVVLAALLVGGLIGEAIDVERRLQQLGDWAQKSLHSSDSAAITNIGEGFVTASLLFCVGPLTILGSLSNGLTGDMKLLAIKSTLDGFAALALAATLGWGVLLSLVTIFLIQGGISLGAGAISPLLQSNGAIVLELVATGGFLLIGIGLRLLKLADLKPGNFLPALFVIPLLVIVVTALPFGIAP